MIHLAVGWNRVPNFETTCGWVLVWGDMWSFVARFGVDMEHLYIICIDGLQCGAPQLCLLAYII
jgi:hypothetical protein